MLPPEIELIPDLINTEPLIPVLAPVVTAILPLP